MKENQSRHWAVGCKIVQWRYNTQYHQTLKDTPYHLTFGQHPRVGISNLPILPEILSNLSTEAELLDVYASIKSNAFEGTSAAASDSVEGTSAAPVDSVVTGDNALSTPVPTDSVGNKRGSYATSQNSRETNRAKRMAIEKALPMERETVNVDSPVDSPPDAVKGDLAELDIAAIRWMELHRELDGNGLPLMAIAKSRIGTSFAVIRCINTKDVNDVSNWQPAILKKVMKETWEILDMHERDKVSEDLELDGDDGLKNNWGMYLKSASDEYVRTLVAALQDIQYENEKNDVSPRRASLRDRATANVKKRAEKVQKKALTQSPTSAVKLGDVVLVPLDGVDRTKVDGGNLVGVIVSINKDKSTCRVAVKRGVLRRAYSHHNIRIVPEASNNRQIMELEDAFTNWRSLPQITEREAARHESSVGGQGMVKCNCKGECTSNSCACKKAGRLCSSRCHRNNKCCLNNKE